MFKPLSAVLAAAIVTSKILEAFRSREANKLEKKADVPQSTEQPSTSGEMPVYQDSTGAKVRAFAQPDGVELYTREYLVHAGTQARGVIVLVHGWTWHSGYFQPFAEFLTKNGFVVVTFDLRGHGRSGLVDGIPGYSPQFKDFTNDAAAVLQLAQERHPGMPSFIWGESMGGTIILDLLTSQPEHAAVKALQGFVISATPVKLPENLLPPKPVIMALTTLGFAFPKLPMPSTMTENFDESFGDVASVPKMREDELIHWGSFRLRMVASLLRVSDKLLEKSKAIKIPWLGAHVQSLNGDNDIKTDIKYAKELYDESVCEDKTFSVYNGARHQLLQDKPDITTKVMQDSLDWMIERLE